jgi:hypothetical protein
MQDGHKQKLMSPAELARVRAAYMPTPEQFEALSKVRSFHEKENLLEEFALEAMASVEVQPEAQTPPANLPKDEVSNVVETETQKQEPEPPAPQQPVYNEEGQELISGQPVENKDVEFWKKQAETWKKRKGDADRQLTPSQQEAARLRKEAEEARVKYEERLANMESLLKQLADNKTRKSVELDPDDEVDSNYPDIARKIRATTSELEERIRREQDERIRKIEERNRQFEQASEESQKAVYAQSHFAQLKAIHPDAEDFISDKLGPALVEWAKTQPEELMDAILNPLAHTPQYVGYVITQFKNVTRYTPPSAKKPSLGDLATRVTSSTQVKQPDSDPDVFPKEFTEKNLDLEMRKINNLYKTQPAVMNKAIDDLIAKYERTLNQRK